MEITAGTQDDFQESLSVELGYDGLEVNQCPLNWQLENLGRHHQYWKLYTGFKTTKLPSNRCILRGRSRMFQQDNPDPHILQLVEESGCRSAAKSFHQMETFKRQSKKYYHLKYDKEDTGLLSRQEWETFVSQKSSRWSPRFTDSW